MRIKTHLHHHHHQDIKDRKTTEKQQKNNRKTTEKQQKNNRKTTEKQQKNKKNKKKGKTFFLIEIFILIQQQQIKI